MHELMVWLLVVDALLAAAAITHRGRNRPLVPAVIHAMPARPRPTLSDETRSRWRGPQAKS